MDRTSRRIVDRLKADARADARSMEVTYAQRLDAHAGAIAYRDWDALQRALREDGSIDSGAQMIAAMHAGGGTVHVDAECALAMQEEETSPDEAYEAMMRRSLDVAAVAEAIARPRGGDDRDDYRLRRDVVLRALWRRPGGSDRIVQAAAELVSALAFLMADVGLHEELRRTGVLPLLWVGRPPAPHMLRDALMLVAQTPFGRPGAHDASATRYVDDWWNAVADAVAAHLPTGVSGWLRDVIGGTATCAHAGCGGGRGHVHHHPHSEKSRQAALAIAFERIDRVCGQVDAPPAPDAATVEAVRSAFERTVALRRAQRMGGDGGDQGESARQLVDAFLSENGRAFGDPVWPWDATMAKRLADMSIEHEGHADG